MKIFPVEKIREADRFTIENEPISSLNLMERAATLCADWLIANLDRKRVTVVVGQGNNGGDGLVIARKLYNSGYEVDIVYLKLSSHASVDLLANWECLPKQVDITTLNADAQIPGFVEDSVIVDAIFGSGLSRPVTGFIGNVIEEMNRTSALKIAIDVPSGLFVDQSNCGKKGVIFRADYTLSFAPPKLAFFLPETSSYVGEWVAFDIGFHPDFYPQVEVQNHYLSQAEVASLLIARGAFSHKGTFGHGLLIAGKYGSAGSAVLAAKAAIRSGVGLLTAHLPQNCVEVMQVALPEAMVSVDSESKYWSEAPLLDHFTAVGVGPGIGQSKQTASALKVLIQQIKVPAVFDADALNILAENKTWLEFLPKNSVLTPHPKEFERLFGKTSNDFSRLELQRAMAIKYGVVLILKGHFTTIAMPDGNCFFNTTGNSGMATGGSGDVLTGMITSLLAQRYTPQSAAILAVYLHGLAADLAVKEIGAISLMPSDIIRYLPKAFQVLTN